jgi:hypothetical protein
MCTHTRVQRTHTHARPPAPRPAAPRRWCAWRARCRRRRSACWWRARCCERRAPGRGRALARARALPPPPSSHRCGPARGGPWGLPGGSGPPSRRGWRGGRPRAAANRPPSTKRMRLTTKRAPGGGRAGARPAGRRRHAAVCAGRCRAPAGWGGGSGLEGSGMHSWRTRGMGGPGQRPARLALAGPPRGAGATRQLGTQPWPERGEGRTRARERDPPRPSARRSSPIPSRPQPRPPPPPLQGDLAAVKQLFHADGDGVPWQARWGWRWGRG